MPKTTRPDLRIPDHEVLRKIGGGAYGEVWLAQAVTGTMRAVKVVWRDDFEDERTFEREFEGILRFEPISRDHRGLVNVLHVGRSLADGVEFYYYVMELGDDVENGQNINPADYEARTLRSDMKMKGGDPLETLFCVETGRRLAEALTHLHECGLAHRDVKPANVIFVGGKAKLADIGLVAARDQRTFVGTEGFVPPEGPGSAQADVYSLGKVLYEMATGKDRLDFPELPDEGVPEKNRKAWLALNRVICDICEPHISKRKIVSARELAEHLSRIEHGKSRRRKISASFVFSTFLALITIFMAWQWWALTVWGTVTIISVEQPKGPALATVKVVSVPEGVDVLGKKGIYLGVTPLTLNDVERGEYLDLQLTMARYRPKSLKHFIPRGRERSPVLIEIEMETYSPPVENDVWVDCTGMDYFPYQGHHLSAEMVGERVWEQFITETGDKYKARMVQVSEGGQARRVVLVNEEMARKYTDWLTRTCVEGGQLPRPEETENMMEIRPKMNRSFPDNLLPPDLLGKNLWPFNLEVLAIPYGTLIVNSEPTGARVYVDGEEVGVTPWEGEVAPGLVSYIVEKEGFKRNQGSFSFGDKERKEMVVKLEKNEGVIFGLAWANSLGMKFVPLGEDLMVCVWETRVKDYGKFAAETKRKLVVTQFDQTPDDPVVFVSRDDAEAFCEWLTKRERGQRLQNNHRYRLPTDKEWSQMIGLKEYGDFPNQADVDALTEGIFPWGREWPPPKKAGNYAGEEAANAPGIAANKVIANYRDGFPRTAPVGSFPPNALGIFDLGGSVQEWVSDSYSPAITLGVARGGSWNSFQKGHLESRHRNALPPTVRDNLYGFRVVLAKDESDVSSEHQ